MGLNSAVRFRIQCTSTTLLCCLPKLETKRQYGTKAGKDQTRGEKRKDAFRNACEGLTWMDRWGGTAEKEVVTALLSLQGQKRGRLTVLKKVSQPQRKGHLLSSQLASCNRTELWLNIYSQTMKSDQQSISRQSYKQSKQPDLKGSSIL